MKNEITCVFKLAIREGQLPAFRQLVANVVKEVEKEPHTKSYFYSLSDDEKTVDIIERYNPEGVVSHVDVTFAPFAEKFLSQVSITSLTVYGTPDAEIKKRLDPFGAVYMTPFAGFSR